MKGYDWQEKVKYRRLIDRLVVCYSLYWRFNLFEPGIHFKQYHVQIHVTAYYVINVLFNFVNYLRLKCSENTAALLASYIVQGKFYKSSLY